MDKEAKAIDMLRMISKKGDCFFYATVTKITGDTCSVKIAELELSDVRIKATNDGSQDKLTVTPTKDSKVIVGCNNGDLRDLFLVKVDDPEKIFYQHKNINISIDGSSGDIIINKGENGGLVIVGKATERLNNIEKDINDLKQIFQTWVVAPQDGGSALFTKATPWANQPLIETLDSDMHNTKVKH